MCIVFVHFALKCQPPSILHSLLCLLLAEPIHFLLFSLFVAISWLSLMFMELAYFSTRQSQPTIQIKSLWKKANNEFGIIFVGWDALDSG